MKMVKYKIDGFKDSQLPKAYYPPPPKYIAIMEESEKVSGSLTTGTTYFLPKLGDNSAVRIYQPITCLL